MCVEGGGGVGGQQDYKNRLKYIKKRIKESANTPETFKGRTTLSKDDHA